MGVGVGVNVGASLPAQPTALMISAIISSGVSKMTDFLIVPASAVTRIIIYPASPSKGPIRDN